MPDLLTSEAVSNYIVFILGTVFGIVGWLLIRWMTRKRPKIVRVIKTSESSLLEVDSAVKDEITIIYKEKPIESLYLTEFVLNNTTTEILDDIEVIVNFQSEGIIEVNIEDSIPKRESLAKKLDSEDGIQISLPFINSEKLYKDKVMVKIFSLKPIEVKSIIGGGREWKVDFIDRQRLVSELVDGLIDELSAYDPLEIVRNPLLLLRLYIRFAPKFFTYMSSK